MNIELSKDAQMDLAHWQSTDPKMYKRVLALMEEAKMDPEKGAGKPTSLVKGLRGFWSRRIDQIHRMVYRFDENGLYVLQLRYHYR